MAPIYIALGFAAGFMAGVNYGHTHKDPWKELSETVTEFALWARRTAHGGPTAPDPDAECPGEDASENE